MNDQSPLPPRGPLLAAVPNFRDFGGQRVADGRRIANGALYRSSQMSRLTEEDRSQLEGLGIRAVVDLRSQQERAGQPTPFPIASGPHFASPKLNTDFVLEDIFADTELEPVAWARSFQSFYEQLPYIYAPEYREMMDLLVNGIHPILIHCSAGKDRTGVACGIILDILGVSRDQILDDYLLSSHFLDGDVHFQNMFTDAHLDAYVHLPIGCRQVMLGTSPDFLRATFSEIDRQHGSTENYAMEILGLTERGLDQFKARLTSTEQ